MTGGWDQAEPALSSCARLPAAWHCSLLWGSAWAVMAGRCCRHSPSSACSCRAPGTWCPRTSRKLPSPCSAASFTASLTSSQWSGAALPALMPQPWALPCSWPLTERWPDTSSPCAGSRRHWGSCFPLVSRQRAPDSVIPALLQPPPTPAASAGGPDPAATVPAGGRSRPSWPEQAAVSLLGLFPPAPGAGASRFPLAGSSARPFLSHSGPCTHVLPGPRAAAGAPSRPPPPVQVLAVTWWWWRL